jgi:hypothetical protein
LGLNLPRRADRTMGHFDPLNRRHLEGVVLRTHSAVRRQQRPETGRALLQCAAWARRDRGSNDCQPLPGATQPMATESLGDGHSPPVELAVS